MTRSAVAGAVAVVVAVIAAVSAPAAVAKPVVPPIPEQVDVSSADFVLGRSDGALTLQASVLTSGLQALVNAFQHASWGGPGVLAAGGGSGTLVCIGSGYSTGSILTETSTGTFGLTCTTTTPKPKLTCGLQFLRAGAGMDVHGTCSLATLSATHNLTAQGALTWVPLETAPVQRALLTGTIGLVD